MTAMSARDGRNARERSARRSGRAAIACGSCASDTSQAGGTGGGLAVGQARRWRSAVPSSPSRVGAGARAGVARRGRARRARPAAPDPATRRAAAPRARAARPGTRRAAGARGARRTADDDVRLAAADAAIRLRAAGATDAVASWLNAPDASPAAQGVRGGARAARARAPWRRWLARWAIPTPRCAPRRPTRWATRRRPTPCRRCSGGSTIRRPRCASRSSARSRASATRARSCRSWARCRTRRRTCGRRSRGRSGDLGDARASSALVLALRDQNNDVRRDALAALGRMQATRRGRRHRPVRGGPRRRAAARRRSAALGRIASPDAVRVLVQALGDGGRRGGVARSHAVRDALVAGGAGGGRARCTRCSRARRRPPAATSAAWVLGELKAKRRGAGHRGGDAAGRAAGRGGAARARRRGDGGRGPGRARVRRRTRARWCAARRSARRWRSSIPHRPTGARSSRSRRRCATRARRREERARMAALLGRTGAPRAAPLLVELAHAHDPDACGWRRSTRWARSAGEAPGAADARTRTTRCSRRWRSPDAPDAPARRRRARASRGRARRATRCSRSSTAATRSTARRCSRRSAACWRARRPTRRSQRLAGALELAAGPERDAIVEALGRAPLAAGREGARGRRASATSRAIGAAAAALLARSPGRRRGARRGRALLATRRGRAGAGGVGARDARRRRRRARGSRPLARRRTSDAAPDAVAAHRRIAARGARGRTRAGARSVPLAGDPRAVRARERAGRPGARRRRAAATGRAERAASPRTRARTCARRRRTLLSRAPSADDARALDGAPASDPSGAVAGAVPRAARPPARTQPALVYVVSEAGHRAAPGRAFAMLLADGTLHAGTTDRRGAVFDPAAPEGEIARCAGRARWRADAPRSDSRQADGVIAVPHGAGVARESLLAAPEPLEAILARAGESRFARSRPPIAAAVWRDAVGARIAERAPPAGARGRRPRCSRVPSSVWAHELSLLADDVCAPAARARASRRASCASAWAASAVDRRPSGGSRAPVPVGRSPCPPSSRAPSAASTTTSCARPSRGPPRRTSPGRPIAAPGAAAGGQRSAASRSSPSRR